MIVTCLSTFGLILAVADYECNVFFKDGRGLDVMNGNEKVDIAVIDAAIKIRHSGVFTPYFRWAMVSQSAITIMLMLFRQYLKVGWSNTEVAK